MNFTSNIILIKSVDSHAIRICGSRFIAVALQELYTAPLDSKYVLYKR